MMRSLHFVGQVQASGNSGAGVPEYLRHMIVYDRQPNGAPPAIADLLLDYFNNGTTQTNSFSGINMNNADRFVVLRDMRVHIPTNAGGQPSAQSQAIEAFDANKVNINEFILLKNLETHYKSTTNPAAIGDIATGALWFVQFGSASAATCAYAVDWTARLRYTDV